MHLHSYSAKYEVPIGAKTLSGVSTDIVPEETAEERQEFSDWLLQRWREKDDRLEMFLNEGKLSKGKYVDIPVKLRSPWELVSMLSCAVVGLWLWKISIVFVWKYILFR
jgi:hypothetical protein